MRKTAFVLIFAILTGLFPVFAAYSGEIAVVADGQGLNMAHKPFRDGKTVFFPVRDLFEGLGMTVGYNDETQEITAAANDFKFGMKINSAEVRVEGVPLTISESVRLLDDCAYVSSELIDEYMQYLTKKPVWDKNTVYIEKPIIEHKDEYDAQKVLSSLSGGETILDMSAVFSAASNSNDLKISQTEVKGEVFNRALTAETLVQPNNIYDIQLVIRPTRDIMAGEVAVLSYWARKISTTDESGMGYVGPCYEENYGDYTKLASNTQELDDNWRQYFVLLAPKVKNFTSDKSQFTLRFGFKPQTVQIADLKIVNYHDKYKYEDVAPNAEPADKYHGMEDGALWRREALARIEKYRKRDISVKVKTENGTPISDAEVSVDMTKNEFAFGTAVHNTFLQSGTSEKATKYREAVLDLFNTVVYDNAGKWSLLETNRGVYASGILNWANQNDITVRGHAIFWDQIKYLPQSLQAAYPYMTDDQIRDRITEHVNDVMTQYKGAIGQWDVLNEPLNNNVIMKRLGYGEIVRWFNLAKAINPDVSMYVNETGISGRAAHWNNVYKLYDLVKTAKDSGAAIDGIGIQTHCGNSMSYPQEFYNQIDYLSSLVDEIAITEYDFTPTLEEMEAPYLRDMLIAAYSHPKCTGFITWGFWDSQHWKNHAPFYKADWTPRDTVAVWKHYTQGEWETHESGKTDENGEYNIRGHRGEYTVTVKYANKTEKVRLRVTEDGENTVWVTVGPSGIKMKASELPKEYKDVDVNGLFKYRTDYTVDKNGVVSGSGEKYELTELPEEEDKRIAEAANASRGETIADTSGAVIKSVRCGGKELPSLTDKNAETHYLTDEHNPEIVIELKRSADVGSLTVNWYESKIYTYNYEIYVSEDGTEWTKIGSGRSKSGVEKYTIGKKCRFIKIASLNPTEFLGITDISIN